MLNNNLTICLYCNKNKIADFAVICSECHKKQLVNSNMLLWKYVTHCPKCLIKAHFYLYEDQKDFLADIKCKCGYVGLTELKKVGRELTNHLGLSKYGALINKNIVDKT